MQFWTRILWNTQSKFMFIYTDRVCLVEMEQLHSCYCEIVDRYLQSLCRTPCWWPSLVPDECLVISDARQLIVCMAWKYQTLALPKRQLVLCFANWPACISCCRSPHKSLVSGADVFLSHSHIPFTRLRAMLNLHRKSIKGLVTP